MAESVRVLLVARPAVVDDVARALEEAAGDVIEIHPADSVAEAHEALEEDAVAEDGFDCVVSGQVLPDGTGFDLLCDVERAVPGPSTILFPEEGSESLASDAFAAGLSDYLPREGPESYDTLVARIHAAVGATRAAADRSAAIDDAENATARFETLMELMPSPAVLTDPTGGESTVKAVNPAFEATFGFDAESVVGRALDDLIIPQEHESVNIPDDTSETIEVELRRRTVDGVRDFRFRGTSVPGADENLSVYTDITEWNQQRQRLRVLSRVLRHDIRNRMNIIEGRSALLADQLEDPDRRETTRKIRSAAVELMSLSEKTQRVEGAMAESTSRRRLDVVDELITVLSGLSDAYPEAEIHSDVPEAAWIHGTAALPTALEEVVRNAIEHNPAETPQVWVTVRTDGTSVEVEIVDDGPPIPETEVELVTGAREATQLEHASGLGLWMVTWIVGGTGGDIEFEQTEDGGNAVSLRFPAATPPDRGIGVE